MTRDMATDAGERDMEGMPLPCPTCNGTGFSDAAPVEEKEGSEEPNPLVGEKAPDSAGATLMERLDARWRYEWMQNGAKHAARFFLLAVADEIEARSIHEVCDAVALYLRTEAER